MRVEKQFYVYMHVNKINGKKYIGSTSKRPEKRWDKGRGYKTQYFYKAIQKYGWDNFEHIVIAEGLSNEEAHKLETDLIKEYHSLKDEHGYNIFKTGALTGEYVGRRVCQFDYYGNYITTHEKICDAEELFNIPTSNIVCVCNKRMFHAGSFIWRYEEDEEGIKNLKDYIRDNMDKYDYLYPVYQFAMDGKLVKEYPNASAAFKENPRWYSNNILDVCRGRYKYCDEYFWRFTKDVADPYHFEVPTFENKPKPGHEVLQFDLEGNFLKEYFNAYEAAEELGCDSHTITYACSGRTQTGKGYLWRYKRDYKGEQLSYKPCIRNTKKVVQKDMDGNVINYFISATVAEKATNISRSDIQANCALVQKSAHGYRWEYLPNNEFPEGATPIYA